LKTDATRPAAINGLQQQARFDQFVHRYNHERPHQALDMKPPASVYVPSPRPYRGLEELEYPFHDWTAVITTCGRIHYQRRKINVSQVFAGQMGASSRWTTTSRSSPSCTTSWGTSTMRRAGWSRSAIRSARHCHSCLRNGSATYVSRTDIGEVARPAHLRSSELWRARARTFGWLAYRSSRAWLAGVTDGWRPAGFAP
jgi:putative transposase